MKIKPALLAISFTLAALAYAQDAAPKHMHQHTLVVTSPGKAVLPGGIDGSKTPELIPDGVAYRVFFRALTVNPKPDRLRAFLGPANLSDADFALVVGTGPEFEFLRSAYRQHERQAVAAASSNGTALDTAALEAEKTNIGVKVKTLLQSRLSPQGMASLDALIQSEKRKMTIFPSPDMSGAK
jgi:hypothetical protein